MTISTLTRWFSVIVAAGSVAPVLGASGQNVEKSLTPQHEMALKNDIQMCAERVNCASSVDERVRYQELLCKKLVQAEDYDRALQAATAVYSTAGANGERRAVAHFTIAKIYEMRMSKSATVQEGEDFRQRSIAVAQEVMAANYPAAWDVGNQARKLLGKLQDRRHLAQVQADLVKNQSGGVAPSMVDIAQRQSAAMAASVNSARQGGYATPGRTSARSILSRGGASYVPTSAGGPIQGLVSRAGASNEATYGTYSTGSATGTGSVSFSRANPNYGSYGTIANRSTAAGEVRSSGRLTGPVIVNGANRTITQVNSVQQ